MVGCNTSINSFDSFSVQVIKKCLTLWTEKVLPVALQALQVLFVAISEINPWGKRFSMI